MAVGEFATKGPVMKLLGQPNSINVRKVLWTAAELGLSLEREDWGTAQNPTSDPSFLAITPKALVPVLIDGDLTLSESNTICRYLARRAGQGALLPTDPTKAALVESWMDWQLSELNTAWRYAFMGRVRQHPDFTDPAAQEASAQAWSAMMTLLDKQLAQTQAYACGEVFTLADILLALSTNRWEMTPMDRPTLPHVQAWMGRLSDRAGFKTYCRNGVA